MKVLCLFLISLAAAETQNIPVPKPFLVCKSHAECTTTVQLCGCCDFIAMNQKHIHKYAALERYCKEPRPPCTCAAPKTEAKCVKKICRLVPKK